MTKAIAGPNGTHEYLRSHTTRLRPGLPNFPVQVAIVGLILIGLIGCASMKAPTVTDFDQIAAAKSAYVVEANTSTDEMRLAVQKAISDIGIALPAFLSPYQS
ncbi:hypothetical protein [Desulfosalsimonas sp.]|uniref:hypothetical protein n=1 Tax=Desulfosalsimonas sp. TaxID=3073848 RepID=UPI0039709D46